MSLVACGAVGSHSDAAASFCAMACEVKSFPAEILSAQGNEEATNEMRGKSEYDTASEGSKISVLQVVLAVFLLAFIVTMRSYAPAFLSYRNLIKSTSSASRRRSASSRSASRRCSLPAACTFHCGPIWR
jgi:hypothetical protein